MKIQFVCEGNTFRSRMAEAYLLSRKLPGVEVTSSGTAATHNINGPYCYYTLEILKQHNLLEYQTPNWRLTNKAELEAQDLVIFMDKRQEDHCLNELHCRLKAYQTWNIPDVPPDIIATKDLQKILPIAEDRLGEIQRKTDKLLLT